MGYVERALVGGALRNLEELNLSGNYSIGGVGLKRILGVLGQGACPRLRRLSVPARSVVCLKTDAVVFHAAAKTRPRLENNIGTGVLP